MATANTSAPPKFNFPGPVGSKRRRMRSGGNVSTLTNNGTSRGGHIETDSVPEGETIVTLAEADDVGEKVVQTSKCKGATTIPIFLKKTYKMIDTCDPSIASWTDEGDMFVVKDPDLFAARVIPQYFDHNKFSSFARQLNFYGFRKMQSKPIRNSDFDAGTAKHVTFFNENFKRGRCDLLKKIQRSTRGTGASSGQDQARELQSLREQVATLENKVQEMTVSTEERLRRLELDMLARIEQVMMAMQQQQQAQLRLHSAASIGTVNSTTTNGQRNTSMAAAMQNGRQQSTQAWETLQAAQVPRNTSTAGGPPQMASFPPQPQRQALVQATSSGSGGGAPLATTLPPHPKQKQFPMPTTLPGAMGAPPDRLNSLRGISTLSRGLSGVPRGTSVESSASAVLMRNSWEDKFFSMLMLDENGQNNAAAAAMAAAAAAGGNPAESMMAPTPLAHAGTVALSGGGGGPLPGQEVAPPMVSEQTSSSGPDRQRNGGGGNNNNSADDMSSVSSSDIP